MLCELIDNSRTDKNTTQSYIDVNDAMKRKAIDLN